MHTPTWPAKIENTISNISRAAEQPSIIHDTCTQTHDHIHQDVGMWPFTAVRSLHQRAGRWHRKWVAKWTLTHAVGSPQQQSGFLLKTIKIIKIVLKPVSTRWNNLRHNAEAIGKSSVHPTQELSPMQSLATELTEAHRAKPEDEWDWQTLGALGTPWVWWQGGALVPLGVGKGVVTGRDPLGVHWPCCFLIWMKYLITTV